MLGDIDWSLKVILPKIFICKPNRMTIGILPEAFNIQYNVKLGNVYELTFAIPQQIDQNHEMIDNPHVALLKDRYLIRFEYGNAKEWFIIDSPSINVEEDKNYNEIKCYSLAYQLRSYAYTNYATTTTASDGTLIDTAYTATHLLTDALSKTNWSVGFVDASFDTQLRSFKESKITALDFVLKIGESFQGIVEFDTENKKVNLYTVDSVGADKGLYFSYGHYVKVMKKELQKENFCTRLNAYGKNSISINSVNPTGTDYIEDFTYFIYPYQEDANGNVIQSSDYMSDGLCHAILAYNKKVEVNKTTYSSLLSQLSTAQMQLTTDQNTLTNLQTQLAQQQDNLTTANATNNVDMGTWNSTTTYKANNVVTYNSQYYKALADNTNVIPNSVNNTSWTTSDGTSNLTYQTQINSTNTQISNQQTTVNNDNANITSIQNQISSLQSDLAIQNNFTPDQIKERNDFVEERDFTDNNIDDPQALYDAALKAFDNYKIPQPLITIDIVNFREIVECQHDWDKLNIGDTVTVYYPQFDTNVKAKIVEIDYNFDEDGGGGINDNQCKITISYFKNVLTKEQRQWYMQYKLFGSSTTVDMNKYKWDDSVASVSSVQQILDNTWDANKRAITAGVNESVKLDNRGLTIKDPNDPNTYLVATHSILSITTDGGQTWKEAITKNGVVAERLYGQVIMGENLTIGSNDGLLNFVGNKGTIYDRSGKLVMAMGLYDTVSTVDKFGIKLYGSNNVVYMDSVDGFKITSVDGLTNMFYADGSGKLYANNAVVTGDIKCNTLEIAGKTALTSDNAFIDGSILKNINANTITAGTIDASIITVKNLNASNITTGTLTADKISGGTLSGVTINVTTDATIGDILYMAPTFQGGIIWNGVAQIYVDPKGGTLVLEGTNYTTIGNTTGTVQINGTVEFSGSVSGLSASNVADHNHGMDITKQYLFGHYDSTKGSWVIDGGNGFAASGGHSHSIS